MGYGYGRGYGWGRRGGGGGPGPRWASVASRMPSVEPPKPGVLRVAIGVEQCLGLDSIVSPRFARAPYMLLVDIAGGRIVDVKCYPNAFASGQGAGMGVAQWLVSAGVRVVLASWLGPGAAVGLQQAGVRIYQVQPGVRVIDALRSLGLVA